MRDGLSALGMAVLCPFRRSSMCRYVYRELTRNEVLDLITIVPATACHQKNYVGTYSRYNYSVVFSYTSPPKNGGLVEDNALDLGPKSTGFKVWPNLLCDS